MGVAAILVMRHRSYEHNFVPRPHGGPLYNLVSMGLAISEEMFENVDDADATDDKDDVRV